MAILPDELIVEILLLLPIATLLQFRCVSKKWLNLIDSPDFVKSHFNRRNEAHSMIIFLCPPNAYQIELDTICNYKLKLLRNPCLEKAGRYRGVLGPCNGLLCIVTDFRGTFCLWNPSTGKHFHVPQFPLNQPDQERIWSWGLGYDCNSDDFKVVCIVWSVELNDDDDDEDTAFVIWIYSLKSGFWKSVGRLPYRIGYTDNGVFVNGAVHWVVSCHSEPSDMVVAFDLGKLECNLLPLPKSRGEEIGMQIRLGELGGYLYAIYHERDSNVFDLWVMKEYGMKESWTLLKCPSYVTPLAYIEARDELIFFTCSNAILRCEFETKSFKIIFRPSILDLHSPLFYIPSLVCPQSSGDSNVAL